MITLMKEYYKDPVQTKEAFVGDWLRPAIWASSIVKAICTS